MRWTEGQMRWARYLGFAPGRGVGALAFVSVSVSVRESESACGPPSGCLRLCVSVGAPVRFGVHIGCCVGVCEVYPCVSVSWVHRDTCLFVGDFRWVPVRLAVCMSWRVSVVLI